MQHVLPDTNAGNWAKKTPTPGSGLNVTAMDVAWYHYEDTGAWAALRGRMSKKPPPRIFAANLPNAFTHFLHHCGALLNDSATVERLKVRLPSCLSASADRTHGNSLTASIAEHRLRLSHSYLLP